jgi:hypothetical protein
MPDTPLLDDGIFNAEKTKNMDPATFGNRVDGTPKGFGFFGILNRPDGDISTELSAGVNFGEGDLEIPLIVPTLTRGELNQLLSGQSIPNNILDKAVQHARGRLQQGLSPFAQRGEDLIAVPLQ